MKFIFPLSLCLKIWNCLLLSVQTRPIPIFSHFHLTQFRLWAFLYWVPACHYPDIYGFVTVATAPVFTSSVVPFVDWMLLTIFHTWHLPICHVSSPDACKTTIALPLTSKVYPISTIYPSPHLAYLPWGAPGASFQISLSSCSTWSPTETEATAPLLFGHAFWCPAEAIDTFHCSQCLCPALWSSQIPPRHRSAVHKHWGILWWRSAWCVKCWNCSIKCKLQQ